MYQKVFRRVWLARAFPTVIFVLGMFGAAYHTALFGAAIIAALVGVALLPPKLNYTFTESEQADWDQLQSGWNAVFSSEKLCQIVPRGVENAVDYFPVAPKRVFPLPIRMNVDPPVLKLKDGYLAIMPDAVFVIRDWNAAAFGYDQLKISIDAVGYLENDKIPGDAEVIGSRWLFVNPDGTPDNSRSDNVELPMVKYGRIQLQSETGLAIQLVYSNEKAAAALASHIGSQPEAE